MYLGLAESLPPCRRVPNWPRGWSMFKLLLPTKFWARPTMVIIRETWGIEKHLHFCIMWKLPGSLVLYNSHDSSLIDMLAQFYFWMCIFIFIMGQCLAKNKSNVTRFFIYRLNNEWGVSNKVLTSPWWYADISATDPANWATFTSLLSFLLKQQKSTFLWPGFRPET